MARADERATIRNGRRRRGSRVRLAFATLLIALLLSCASVRADDDADDVGRRRRCLTADERRDERVVRRVLAASAKGEYYRVLGMRENWELDVSFGGGNDEYGVGRRRRWIVPILRAGPKRVKRAYRRRSLSVHPDKNGDPRAAEAFDALERAASVLLDEESRRRYDGRLRETRRQRRAVWAERCGRTWDAVAGVVARVVRIVRRIAGPFAVPIVVLGVLIF